jgi:N-acetylmuramoyl-L-alanine amidase
VVSFPAVTRAARARTVLVAAALALASTSFAQDPAGEPAEAGPTIVAAGVGSLLLIGPEGGAAAALPWVETPAGSLVALAPVAARLGGRLVPGTLGASTELTVGEVRWVLAPGSPALTTGTEILTLSQPMLERDGALFVPIDLVERVWGPATGVTLRWEPTARRLELFRPVARELALEVSQVHVQGVTTIVLRPEAAIRYRVERREDGLDLVPVGDRFRPSPVRRADDPLLAGIRIAPDRVRVDFPAGIEADDYTLSEPFRIVVDLFRPREAAAAATPGATLPPPRPPGLHTVVIDPGHGGAETGAIGPAGTMEKELTLALARSLAARLRSELGLEVVLTRDDDVVVDLDARAALANQHKADLFLSIHLNSTVRGRARGAETYFLSLQATDDRAAVLASHENLTGEGEAAAPGTEHFDLQLLLWDLAQSRHLASSQRFATLVQEELNRALELPDRGVKQAPFRVLMGAAMPAVLVELGFLSNRDEEQRLRDPAYREQLVGTLVRAVARFRAESGGAPTAAGAAP